MSPLRLAWFGLVRRRTTALIALTAIALSVACAGTLLRLHRLSEARFAGLVPFGDALIGAKADGLDILLGAMHLEGPYPDVFPTTLYRTLLPGRVDVFRADVSRVDFIESVIPLAFCAKYGERRVIATTAALLDLPGKPLGLAQGSWVSQPERVVVGAETARLEGLKPGDEILVDPWTGDAPGSSSILPYTLKVAGVLEPMGNIWDGAVFANLSLAETIFSYQSLGRKELWGSSAIHYALLHLKSGGFEDLERIVNARSVAQVISIPAAKARLEALTGSGHKVGLMVALFTAGLGTLALGAALFGRQEALRYNLAVLRAQGHSRRRIAAWLLWEGVLLGVGGCLLGGALEWLMFPYMRAQLGGALPGPEVLSFPPWHSAPLWCAAIVLAALACALPLIRLYRVDAHRALQGQG